MDMLVGDGLPDLQGSSIIVFNTLKTAPENATPESIKENKDANYKNINLNHYPKLKKKYETVETKQLVADKPERFVSYILKKTINNTLYSIKFSMLKEKANENFKALVETMAASVQFPE
ncbi:hypothetical protein [Bacillus sp. 1NLA3E]|uniref:hypothetical protein n=1 Tax=Bacillus sp. 1NLA3E TaxID=666686 RepID=UPI00030215AE|nr:hypothetical protein [Bacillus sp. 1NLA3E]AGK54539.1 hypothetical protein B1NLA3E_13965 [Bacillus sp. 1NLA3E]